MHTAASNTLNSPTQKAELLIKKEHRFAPYLALWHPNQRRGNLTVRNHPCTAHSDVQEGLESWLMIYLPFVVEAPALDERGPGSRAGAGSRSLVVICQ